jgi:hypothetical protein
MYESLKEYAEEKQKQSPHGVWDGNVPANFKTKSNPPLSLGRWINRQRCAYAKNSLKEDHVKQLEAVGLKWVIHARHKTNGEDDNGVVGGAFIRSSSTPIQGAALCDTLLASVPSLPPALGTSDIPK